MKLGDITKALREANGWGTPELAKRAAALGPKKVKYQNIQQLEQKPTMSPAYLPQLAGAFGKSIDELLAWRPGMPTYGPNHPSGTNGHAKPISPSDATVTDPSHARIPRVEVRGTANMDKAGFWTELVDDPEGNGYFEVVTADLGAYYVRIRGGDTAFAMSGTYILLLPSVAPEPGRFVLVKQEDGRSIFGELVSHQDGEYRLQVRDGSKMLLADGDVEYVHVVGATMMPAMLKR